MKVFHNSHSESFYPDYNTLIANISNHTNGHLGLWCCYERMSWQMAFGAHTHVFDLKGNGADFYIGELSAMSESPPQAYKSLREDYLSKGIDFLHLIEGDGSSDMLVVLNLELLVPVPKDKLTKEDNRYKSIKVVG